MTAPCTLDVFSTLDGYDSSGPDGNWGGYWGTREIVELVGLGADTTGSDDWNLRVRQMPANVVSSTIRGRPDWPTATLVSGDSSRSSPG